ncbi:MAG: PP2C family protein-serine/threonine phosphatase [Acidobacteriota bacterium]
MQELWASASYQWHALSLPFAFAPVAMSFVIAYALVMRGASVLRGWLLVHFACLMPYATCMMLSPSLVSPAAAEALFRLAAAFIPMAAAAGAGFQFGLLGWEKRARVFVWIALAFGAAWIVAGAFTDAAVRGVRWVSPGFWYAEVGDFAWLAVVTLLAISLPGFVALTREALRGEPSHERRQLRLALAANAITYSGLVDIVIAYHVDIFPLGWLATGIGSVLVIRALLVEDLLRARAFDTTAPRLVLHLAVALVLGAISLALLEPNVTWWGAVLVLALCCGGARVTLAVISIVNRGARGNEGTLERLLGQLVVRARGLTTPHEAAQLAIDIVQLGVGVRVEVLLAAAEDWGWTTAAGARLDDEAAPDPLLVGWLAEQRGAKFADELAYVPGDLRSLLARLYTRHAARTLVPVASRDELLGLVLVPDTGKPLRADGGGGGALLRLRGRRLSFIERAAERLAEALVHVRMARRAAEAAVVGREVELAAAVQQQLLPGKGPHHLGDVTVVGSWLPATRCAGDFWGVYALDSAEAADSSGSVTRGGSGRVLVAIGDVTGHGVASATVTAAASAACEVIVRRDGAALDLGRLVAALDAAVRRVGGGQLHMTCFATILDPTARELSFVSCGHPTPYLCRANESDLELQALVGRGNPLGSSGALPAKVQQRTLRAGDLVVWYTDGVVDAQDPAGEAFGDRRLQRLLRRLDRTHLAPAAVHSVVHAGVTAHRGGRPRLDDETIVVAQWRPPAPASLEPSRGVTG